VIVGDAHRGPNGAFPSLARPHDLEVPHLLGVRHGQGFPVVQDLFETGRTRRPPIRLLGLAFSNLDFFDVQLRLFDNDQQLCSAVDAIREKYGYDAVRIAVSRGAKNRAR